MPRRDRERRVDEVLDLVELRERAGDRVDSLAGGMRRRLNIGAGLVHWPSLLVLDEPTVGVDPQSRHAIMESVTRFGQQGMAVLYTTHYMEEAERLCDRVGIIDRGRLVAQGSPRELVSLVAERDRVRLTAVGDLTEYVRACRGLARVEGSARTGTSTTAAASTCDPAVLQPRHMIVPAVQGCEGPRVGGAVRPGEGPSGLCRGPGRTYDAGAVPPGRGTPARRVAARGGRGHGKGRLRQGHPPFPEDGPARRPRSRTGGRRR
ncbi:ATP-binding cassette domain-containing protein [Streptomyces niveiscabiei]|uniref:ATP-binding cassette domain-containing protein n=1 Tax=Streptomyces niveiscabiei TaxID=164115 RepID=A0ABW9HQR2_9ACTN